MTDQQDRKAFFRELGKYSALGLEMALSVVIGMGIGYYLDRWLGTGPWLMIVWIALGFAAGVRSLYRAAVRSGKDLERDEETPRKPGGP
jgi:ATP synthase protein I